MFFIKNSFTKDKFKKKKKYPALIFRYRSRKPYTLTGHHKLLKPWVCLEGTKCLPIFFFCMLLHRSCHPGKAANSLEGELPEIHKYLKVLAKIKSQIQARCEVEGNMEYRKKGKWKKKKGKQEGKCIWRKGFKYKRTVVPVAGYAGREETDWQTEVRGKRKFSACSVFAVKTQPTQSTKLIKKQWPVSEENIETLSNAWDRDCLANACWTSDTEEDSNLWN